ncbi:hypothetical protein SDC9_56528 [bioreactor metagenome]|uniref:Uncharacterized protein n=1 Tax=bioreactor metagenome TaxID=1076179 RepID=A0A644X2T9_9ZZZZ
MQKTTLVKTAITTLVLSAALVTGASAANLGRGTITADSLNLRAQPTTASSILATAPKNEVVVVLGEAENNWYPVQYNTTQGYMLGDYLTVETVGEDEPVYAYVNTGCSNLNMRSGAGTGYSILAKIPGGTTVPVAETLDGWYKVTYSGSTGYVSSQYVLLAADESGAVAAASTSSVGSEIVAYAKNFLGCKYVWGANGPNCFDCSGFTKYIYAHFGYTLNRTATNQLSNGVSVSRTELEPGDLVFFKYQTSKPVSHVGIYIGGGYFIHASSTGGKVEIDTLASGHYCNVLVYARRIV